MYSCKRTTGAIAAIALLALANCSNPINPEVQREIERLRAENPEAKGQAIARLFRMGAAAAPAAGELRRMVEQPSPLRGQAALALVSAASDDPRTLSVLIAALKDEKTVAIGADLLTALGMLGPRAQPALGLVIPFLRHSELLILERAIYAVARIDPRPANLEGLYRLARDGSRDGRLHALQAIIEMGPDKALDPQPVVAALADADPDIAREALKALWVFGERGNTALPHIQRLLHSVGQAKALPLPAAGLLIRALWRIDPSGIQVRSILLGCLATCREVAVRRMAAESCQLRKAADPVMLAALQRSATSDTSPHVRQGAVGSLGVLGKSDRQTQLVLLRVMAHDASSLVSWKAAEALANGGAETAPLLRNLVGSEDPGLRTRIAYALGRSQDAADATREALRTLSQDKEAGVREQARESLQRIESGTVSAKPKTNAGRTRHRTPRVIG